MECLIALAVIIGLVAWLVSRNPSSSSFPSTEDPFSEFYDSDGPDESPPDFY